MSKKTEMEEIEYMLVEKLGMPSTETRILLFILENEKVTSNQICRGLDIQQSLVSKLTANMIDKGFLDRYAEKQRQGRGRKAFVYSLAASKPAIMNAFLKSKVDELREAEKTVSSILLATRRL